MNFAKNAFTRIRTAFTKSFRFKSSRLILHNTNKQSYRFFRNPIFVLKWGTFFIATSFLYQYRDALRSKFAPTVFADEPNFIQVFSEIQDALREVDYYGAEKFPQLVVIGEQSSGKSSVLESIVGRQFIPKGEGTVTKRPLIITLHKTEPGSRAYAKFPQMDIETDDFERVEKIIAKENRDFSSKPLLLDVYSPDTVDLRLVDLPGLVHNPRKDQPSDLRAKIINMCIPYVQNENSIIISVTAGNSDIQTSEAISFARKFDPKGQRTISVLTKLDLVPPESVDTLLNTVNNLPMALGFVGVRCRSKSEVERGVTIEEQKKIEEAFFRKNRKFNQIKTTTPELVNELSRLLKQKMKKEVFNILKQINTDLRNFQTELSKLGGPPKKFSSQQEMEKEILKLMKKYIDETLDIAKLEEIKRELARNVYLSITEECDRELYTTDVEKLIVKTPTSPDELNWWWERADDEMYALWKRYVQTILGKIQPLSESCVEKMLESLKSTVNKGLMQGDYPNLEEMMKRTVHDYLNVSYKHLIDKIDFLISLEKNIRTDSYAIQDQFERVKARRKKAYDEIRSKLKSRGLSKEEKNFLEKQQDFLYKTYRQSKMERYDNLYTEGYVLEVAVRLSTNIFNAVCIEILNPLRDNLTILLTQNLYQSPDEVKRSYLEQSASTMQQREMLAEKIKRLEVASQKLQRLADYMR